ncbi:hypothetical protein D3C80_1669300 [compost metagenome]
MITPTRAQAMPTGTACRAPSTKACKQINKVPRPPLTNQQTTTRAAITAKITLMPNWKNPAHSTPSAIQNATRKPVLDTLRISAEPRMTIAVRARPTMPENNGVRPENNRYTSTNNGISRYQRSRTAAQALGHWSLGKP